MAEAGINIKELRLAIVCYGGVSLAVYMHGITKELGKLVEASKLLEEEEPPESGTESVYCDLLEHLESDKKIRTRVVIDIISGTSAGGINGIYLAKALAKGLSQDPLGDIWIDRAEVWKIMGSKVLRANWLSLLWWVIREVIFFIGLWLLTRIVTTATNTIWQKVSGWLEFPAKLLKKGFLKTIVNVIIKALKWAGYIASILKFGLIKVAIRVFIEWISKPLMKNKPRPPFKGDLMLKWLLEGFQYMEDLKNKKKQAGKSHDLDSLMPAHHSLELFVTTTDFHGSSRQVKTSYPKNIVEKRYRHVLKFVHDTGNSQCQFDTPYNPALAFAARATSSFPGAFDPVNINDLKKEAGKLYDEEQMINEIFRSYKLSNEIVGDRYFIDGGVLDNYPFGHAIKAIIAKPAASQVDRRLIFIDPDPKDSGGKEVEPRPGMLSSLIGTALTIRGQDPIYDDILKINEFNERVKMVNQIIKASEENDIPKIQNEIGSYSGESEDGKISDWRDRMHEEARKLSGYTYTNYTRMKLQSVINQLSEFVNSVCCYPDDSDQAFLVKRVFQHWSESRIFKEDREASSTLRIELLRTFDLKYTERRIRFIIHYINKELYDKAGNDGVPNREHLDTAKGELYEMIAEMKAKIYGKRKEPSPGKKELSRLIKDTLFLEKNIYIDLDEPETSEKWLSKIDTLKDKLEDYYEEKLKDFRVELWNQLKTITGRDDWGPDIRDGLMNRYLFFPFWDVLTFPLHFVSDIGELDPIEVVRMSPKESCKLSGPEKKDKLGGAGLGHFAAFFNQKLRENDYLWGRLDAAEQLIRMIVGGDSDKDKKEMDHYCREAFERILGEEKNRLKRVGKLISSLEDRIKN